MPCGSEEIIKLCHQMYGGCNELTKLCSKMTDDTKYTFFILKNPQTSYTRDDPEGDLTHKTLEKTYTFLDLGVMLTNSAGA
jgi:hypothetical protein